jgi:hypothetical protein
MRMQTTPGQRITTISGHHYNADAAGFINDVDPEDLSELQRVGCRPVGTAVELPAPEPPPAVEDLPKPTQVEETGLEPDAAGHHEAPERSE